VQEDGVSDTAMGWATGGWGERQQDRSRTGGWGERHSNGVGYRRIRRAKGGWGEQHRNGASDRRMGRATQQSGGRQEDEASDRRMRRATQQWGGLQEERHLHCTDNLCCTSDHTCCGNQQSRCTCYYTLWDSIHFCLCRSLKSINTQLGR